MILAPDQAERDARLERMYRKVSGGRREGPNLLETPRPIGVMVDANGVERPVYPTSPPIQSQSGKQFFVSEEVAAPSVEPERITSFWDHPVW